MATKRVNFRKMLNLLLQKHKVDEAVTFRTCLWHYPLHKLCFVMNGMCRPLEEEGSFCSLLPTCPVSEVAPVGLIPRFLVLVTY